MLHCCGSAVIVAVPVLMRENDVPYGEMMGGPAGQMETRVLSVPKFPGLTVLGAAMYKEI